MWVQVVGFVLARTLAKYFFTAPPSTSSTRTYVRVLFIIFRKSRTCTSRFFLRPTIMRIFLALISGDYFSSFEDPEICG